jgi:arsenite methyltransferase
VRSRFFAALLATLTLLFSGRVFAQQTAMPPPTQARPLEDRVSSFERSGRDEYQKPDEVVKALEVKNGTVVADIGAGSGYFTRRLARAVAPDGKVYAVDIDAEVLNYLKQQSEKLKLHNIETVVSHEDDPLLPPNAIDLAFFCDVTHHIAQRAALYQKLASALREDGRMAVIDYPPGLPTSPHQPNELVPRFQVISEAEQAGFKLVKEFRFLPRQYFLVFAKQ